MSPSEAAGLIRNGDVVINTGMLAAGIPETILKAIRKRFQESGAPAHLTLVHSGSQSDGTGGIEHIAATGLVDKIIGAHWGLAPKWMDRIASDDVIAYCLPQGQVAHLIREMSSGSPGLFSKVGLGTFIDPRLEGGKMNARTKAEKDIVEVLTIDGEEYLRYLPVSPDVALIRGTYMDEDGNLSVLGEGMKLELMPSVLAVKRNGGRVIAQVKAFVKNGGIHPHNVAVPGIFIDCAAECENPETDHRQCSGAAYDPAICGDGPFRPGAAPVLPLDIRKVIGRRAALELYENAVINLGIGIPNDTIGLIMHEEGAGSFASATVESGVYGGAPLGGADFGVSRGCTAIIPHEQQFDFYNGAGVDIAFMGVGEVGRSGDVNSTKMGRRVTGAGGFINITQNAAKVVFCSTFTTKGLQCTIGDGRITVGQEGRVRKFVERVGQVSFSAARALKTGRQILYVTERAVFRLGARGLILTEIAPGVDVKRDVLDQMAFSPIIEKPPRLMDSRIYNEGAMGAFQ